MTENCLVYFVVSGLRCVCFRLFLVFVYISVRQAWPHIHVLLFLGYRYPFRRTYSFGLLFFFFRVNSS
ncbi:hypothetical protein L1887_40227 [Cichorium endivia]|nr:hypothetical protein L1887_40227 [Cichorium endivia]